MTIDWPNYCFANQVFIIDEKLSFFMSVENISFYLGFRGMVLEILKWKLSGMNPCIYIGFPLPTTVWDLFASICLKLYKSLWFSLLEVISDNGLKDSYYSLMWGAPPPIVIRTSWTVMGVLSRPSEIQDWTGESIVVDNCTYSE